MGCAACAAAAAAAPPRLLTGSVMVMTCSRTALLKVSLSVSSSLPPAPLGAPSRSKRWRGSATCLADTHGARPHRARARSERA
jgi:hypothetical protein